MVWLLLPLMLMGHLILVAHVQIQGSVPLAPGLTVLLCSVLCWVRRLSMFLEVVVVGMPL